MTRIVLCLGTEICLLRVRSSSRPQVAPVDLPSTLYVLPLQRCFHCGLNLQALQIPRNRCYRESAITLLIGYGAVSRIEFSVNLYGIPILRVADVVNDDVVVLTPKAVSYTHLTLPTKRIV